MRHLFYLVYLYSKIPLSLSIQKYNRHSKNVLWIPYKNYLDLFKLVFGGSNNLHDVAVLIYLVNNEKDYRLLFGLKSIRELKDCKIYYTPPKNLNPLGFYNYVGFLHYVLNELSLHNQLLPDLNEVLWWENKEFMHKEFSRLGINNPDTVIVNLNDEQCIKKYDYPFLIKEVHSASAQGVFKVNSNEDYADVICMLKKKGANVFLMQKLLNIRSDLRVIIIGDEIALHYWRHNKSSTWRPTSTGFGSEVDFLTFPEKWKNQILDSFRKTKLHSAGIDITWENDNIDSTPIFLEMSPIYQPNPPLPDHIKNIPYYQYKKKLFIRNPYYKEYINLVIDIKQRILDSYNKI